MTTLEGIQFYYDRERNKPVNDVIDFGEYDIAIGAKRTVFIYNPDKEHVARFRKFDGTPLIKSSHPLVQFDFPPAVMPLETVELKVTFKPMHWHSDMTAAEEDLYFSDIKAELLQGEIRYIPLRVFTPSVQEPLAKGAG